jgi:hypothetical protein
MILSVAGCAVSPALDADPVGSATDAGFTDLPDDSESKQHSGSSISAADAASTKIDFPSHDRPVADAGLSTAKAADAIDAGSLSGASHDAGVSVAMLVDAASVPAVPTPSSPAQAPNVGASSVSTSAPAVSTTAPLATCAVPSEAALEDVSTPTTVVGTGTPASCTSSAFVSAVATGGVITFNCGSAPVTITLDQTAKVFNDKAQKLVIDGGNKVTLSGGGRVRILYQNTCDQNQVWTSAHCDNQEFPQLTVQNLTFTDGNAKGTGDGGGAIFASGGRLKVLNSRFYNSVCDDSGPDLGGGAIYVRQQFNGLPVYVVGSTFGGDPAHANVCSNGGAISSMGVSLSLLNSALSYNRAIGNGANPAAAGTPGGGSGGALYANGNGYALSICGSSVEHNSANEGGGALFFVSNDRTGTVALDRSTLRDNKSGKFENFPGMFVQAKADPMMTGCTLQ